MFPFDLALAGLSCVAGLVGSLIGLGGGIIITPLLVLCFGVDIRYAMGAALVSVIATSSGAAAAYLKEGLSNMRIAMFLSLATTSGAVGGAWLATAADPQTLSFIFGIALLATVVLSLRPPPAECLPTGDALATRLGFVGGMPGGGSYGARHVPAGFATMAVAGMLSGLLGIGSGAFKVLAMDRIMRLPFKVSTTTSNFMIGVTAAASVGVYLKHGYFDPALAGPVALGVLVGAFAGARLLPVAPVKVLRTIFLVAVAAVGFQMIARAFGIHV